jgi:radical SAM protein with 4Fe4S-binding SPASM domain
MSPSPRTAPWSVTSGPGAWWAPRMVGTDFCADAAFEAKADFRIVIKDLATHGPPPQEAKGLIEQTQQLFSGWQERVTVMPVYFHNALGESLVNLSGPVATSNGGVYTLCHQPWVNFTVDFAGRVVGCCRDLRSEYVLGNLLEQPASEIWNGERMVQLRRALTEKRPEAINICKACDVPWQGSYSGRTPLEKVRNFFFAGAWKR